MPKRAKINSDPKGKTAELQRNAAAVVEFKVEIGERLHFHAGV